MTTTRLPLGWHEGMAHLRESVVSRMAVVGRHYPLCRGHGWLARRLLEVRVEPGDPAEVRLRSGPLVLVHPNEFIGRIVFYFGDLDPRISWVCRRVLRPGDTVVDVGANYGVVSLLAADLVGGTGSVHAFEPQPLVVGMLRRSSERNGFDQLHVHDIALSDEDAELELRVPHGNLGGASLSRVSGSGSSITVTVRHSGTVLDELGLSSIRMMKIDIEGHEGRFLRGAGDFLESCPPEVIVFESNDTLYEDGEHIPFWRRETVERLTDLGYDLLRIGQSFGAVSPKVTRVEAGRDDPGLDFVAVHRTRYREIAGLLAIS